MTRSVSQEIPAAGFASDGAFRIWLSEVLAREIDARTILSTAAEALGRHLNVSRVGYGEFDPDLDWITIPLDWTQHGVASAAGRHRYFTGSASDKLYRAGRTEVVHDVEDSHYSAAERAWLAEHGTASSIGVPLVDDGALVAMLGVNHHEPRCWSEEEVSLVVHVAERIWGGLRHLRLTARLREREERFRTLAESIPAICWLGDLEGRPYWMNRQGLEYFGTDDARLSPTLAVHPEEEPSVLAAWARARRDGARIEATVRLRRADGLFRTFLSRAEPIRADDGEIVNWCGVLVDMSDKQANDRRDQLLRSFNDRTRDERDEAAVVAAARELVILHLRADDMVLHDMDAGAPEAFPDFALSPSDHAPIIIRDAARGLGPHDAALLERRYRAAIVLPVLRQDERVASLAIYYGTPHGFGDLDIELSRELADRVWTTVLRARAETELRERERVQAFLIDWSDSVRLLGDTATILTATLQRLGQFLGVARVKYAEDDGEGEALNVLQEWNNGAIVSVERRFPLASYGEQLLAAHRSGEPLVVNDFATDERFDAAARAVYAGIEVAATLNVPLVREGRIMALLSLQEPRPRAWTAAEVQLVREVADRTWGVIERARGAELLARSREALYQTEKLSALGSLLAGVSHELNNPLSIVVAQAVMLERQSGGGELAVRAGKIRAAADRCARIVQTFLAMARQKRPEHEPVQLNTVVTAARELTAYGLRSNGITVECRLDESLPLIAADADQLHHIVVNLIVNAQQAMAAHDSERRLVLRTATGAVPGTVMLEVVDTGPGIPEELRRRVFEPFYTTKPQGEGTGVGLSFSQGLAEAHGGRLEIMPRPQGACFRLTLPIDEGRTTSAPAAVEATPSTPVIRSALVIDDEEEIAASLADFLSLEGFRCEVAVGGEAGLERLASRSYDLVASDLRMPGLDGPKLYAWVVAHRPELANRMGFVTGDTMGAAAAEFLAATRRPVLEKPFLPDGVRRFLQQMEIL